jgi:tripartite-type tricarboxylate transporter receptor subunit TctC
MANDPGEGTMKLPRRQFLHLTAVAVGLLAFSCNAWAQTYPNKTITIVVPAAAGGPTDTVTRLVSESMSRTLGAQIVIENIGGAGGTIGITRAAKAPADGYTLMLYHIGLSTSASLYDNLRYDTLNDFDSIGRVTDVPMTVVGKSALAPRNIAELIAFVKERQQGVTYAHAGIGSASHLCELLLSNALGIKLTTVSYRGTGPAMNDLLGGQIDMMCDQTTNTTNQIKEGRIKGYAVTTSARISALRDLPTLDEAGLKGFEVSAWHALWAPKGTPKEATDKLVAALQAALKDAKVIERFASLGTEPVEMAKATPAALKAQLEAEVVKWGKVIKAAGVKGE